MQLAKNEYHAIVIAVCSTKNQEMARSLGADATIDCLKEDFMHSGKLRMDELLFPVKMLEENKFKPYIDRVYHFNNVVEAHRYVAKGISVIMWC